MYKNEPITIKFVPSHYANTIQTEISNHNAMDAFKNSTSERFGIPNVKYFEKAFDGQIDVIGFTFLESNEEKLNMKRKF